jgi:hypothetical protein
VSAVLMAVPRNQEGHEIEFANLAVFDFKTLAEIRWNVDGGLIRNYLGFHNELGHLKS